MNSKRKQPFKTQAHAVAVAAAAKLSSTTRIRPSRQKQKNVLQIIDRIFDLLEVEFSGVSLVDLTIALGCAFRGRVDSSEENVLRVFHRTFEVLEMEFLEFETEVQVKAIGSVFCGLDVCLSYIDGETDSANLWSDCRAIPGFP